MNHSAHFKMNVFQGMDLLRRNSHRKVGNLSLITHSEVQKCFLGKNQVISVIKWIRDPQSKVEWQFVCILLLVQYGS